MHYMHEFYFESAAMILTLITVGKMLETRAKGKTTNALKSLMKLAPKQQCCCGTARRSQFPLNRSGKATSLSYVPAKTFRWTASFWRVPAP